MNDAERARLAKRKQSPGWCRTNTNKAISRIRQVFRWGVPRKLVSATTLADLECLSGLQPGQGGATERNPVEAVPLSLVEETLPHLPPVVADIVRVLLLTGSRCGELCSMRMGDIDRSGPNWVYSPRRHKTKKRGHVRTIIFGPKSQDILRQYLKANPDAFLFSPREQAERISATKRAKRKSKVQPSQTDRSNPTATRAPGEFFTPSGIGHAIKRVCKKAGLTPWHPHQLRHAAAQRIKREFGVEAAQAILGHRCVKMSDHYAGNDIEKAASVAGRIG